MRIVYFGTPTDAVEPLRALAAAHDVAFVVTQPDRKRGRGSAFVPSPVKVAATELGLAVRTPARAVEVLEELRAAAVDVAVVVAFGQLIPPELLAVPRLGFVNVHYSLLPRWRGAAPVERALLAGDPETGVAIMAMDEGLDTGAIYAEARTSIESTETAGELMERLNTLGVQLLVETLPRIEAITPAPQAGEPVYAKKLTVDEFALDWTRPAAEIARVVRAGNPRPGAFTTAAGKRLKVWRAHALEVGAHATAALDLGDAPPGTVGPNSGRMRGERGPTRSAVVATGAGVLVLDEVQPEGKPRMAGDAWQAGLRGEVVLGVPDRTDAG